MYADDLGETRDACSFVLDTLPWVLASAVASVCFLALSIVAFVGFSRQDPARGVVF